MRKLWIVLSVIIVIALIFVLSIKGGYDRAIDLEQQAEKTWADIDAALQRRADLVPNLVETVKGYATHEKELFENIAKSREKYFQAGSRAEKIDASNQLGGFLSRLLMLQEQYPQLKANENFLTLQSQLEGTENRISVARTRYNEAARQLNAYTKKFFGRFFCALAGVEPVEYFAATQEARVVPEVEF